MTPTDVTTMPELDSTFLERFLQQHGARARILHLAQPTRTVDEAARALGVSARQIVKSLLFCDAEKRGVVAVIRGDQRVNPVQLGAASGLSDLRLAPAALVLELTGYRPGALPPVAHRTALPVVIDPAVLAESVVYAGGGDDDTIVELPAEELLRLSRATVAAISS